VATRGRHGGNQGTEFFVPRDLLWSSSMQTFRVSATGTFLFLASTLARPAVAEVLVVGGGGPGAFVQIQVAATVASDGDVLLVKGGTFAGFTIDDKALTVVADTDAVVVIAGTTIVQNLTAGRNVVLSGLHGRGLTQATLDPSAGVGLLLRANAGFVRVQDSSFEGASGAGDSVGFQGECCDLPGQSTGCWAGTRIENCAGGRLFCTALLPGVPRASSRSGSANRWAGTRWASRSA